MINVVIVGAGSLGSHVAQILSKEKHNVILIDIDAKKLHDVATVSDIATRHGSGTDWQLLDDLLEFSPDLILALTDNDEVNLVVCSIAKQLKYPRTLARIKNSQYLNRSHLDFGRIFDVDSFISPELMVARDILKFITGPGSLMVEHFAHGAMQLRTLKIPESWSGRSTPLKNFELPGNIIVGLIKRTVFNEETKTLDSQIIFPHGNDMIMANDEVTFVGATDEVSSLYKFFSIPFHEVENVVIFGGTVTSVHLATLLLERNITVKIIENDYDICCSLAEKLPRATVIHHDTSDIDFLRAEKIGDADLIVVSMNHDDANMLGGLLAQELGSSEVIVLLNNSSFIPLAARLGLKYTVSPKISATDHILSQLFSGKVTSLVSLYENKAEILEINVSMNSKIVGIPLSELGPFLPKDFLIVLIQNRGRIIIPSGDRIISPGDTVIVVTDPKHVDELEQVF